MDIIPDYDFVTAKDASTPYLLFIHGAGGDKTQWKRQFKYFQTLGYGILIPSLPGHGSSTPIGKISILNYTEIISKLIADLKLKKIILIGHSMGGAITLQYALRNLNSMIEKLILIGTGAKLNVAPIFFELIETDFNKALHLMAQYAYDESAETKVKQENEEILRRNGKGILLKDFKACSDFDIRMEIKSIRYPTLILCGENDMMTPIKFSSYLHENIVESQLIILPKAGHFIFQEKPKEVNEYIQLFIEEKM